MLPQEAHFLIWQNIKFLLWNISYFFLQSVKTVFLFIESTRLAAWDVVILLINVTSIRKYRFVQLLNRFSFYFYLCAVVYSRFQKLLFSKCDLQIHQQWTNKTIRFFFFICQRQFPLCGKHRFRKPRESHDETNISSPHIRGVKTLMEGLDANIPVQ